ncbi:two-component system sensor histidine kinase DesK [Virgibacillus natechei]|uniref:histidine kinase n=1 Tax=Virgibacillus natechei TaxID=1216297 RepID=A0ABS4IH61_9BACI|nr:sensor histidine kinase [Virgibacillus natechei]MBP1970260.1 two-component system sensor histidine kinase DesK [Virgibacillus natechei]UZD12795.1 sensor histidine kinase [Virgibacillus natechei]
MHNWYHIIPKNTGLSAYAWIIFCVLPFYFVFRSSGMLEIIFGIVMILSFFTIYRVSFLAQDWTWTVYLSVSINMMISIVMTIFLGYVYFALFLAFYIGNIQHKGGFISLYVVHLVTTISAVGTAFYTQNEFFFSQLPFIIITVVGVILLPFTLYNRNKRERLEDQLEDANKKISQLVVVEERQRIARDLHDTLGQKLSLIGLKSDLAGKLVEANPETVKSELKDIRQTARTALKEVREMVSDMKGKKLQDEMIRIQQILQAAQIDFHLDGSPELTNTPLLTENVLSMCLKEAVTNVVKHSQATACRVSIMQSSTELVLQVKDDGIGIPEQMAFQENGLQGIKERLEFVNGSLTIESSQGTTLTIHVPHVIQQMEEEELS